MKLYLLPPDNMFAFVKRIAQDGSVFHPIVEDGKAHLIKFDDKVDFAANFLRIRTAENVKHFFFPSRDAVAKFPKDERRPLTQRCLFGVKNCDLRGIDVYDRVFLKWEPLDPFYKERREKTVVISTDCPDPEDSCFCNLVGLNPYGEGICDMNFTQVSDGFLFEVFTKRGEEIINASKEYFKEVGKEASAERDKIRREALGKLNTINSQPLKSDIHSRIENADKDRIRDARDECVECHACLHGCPTCYCFLLSDYKKGKDVERIRLWDACYYAAFARVGGGANPRSRIDERFWNRFQCKFDYFYTYENIHACSGCGRCLLGCSASIDIREILWNV